MNTRPLIRREPCLTGRAQSRGRGERSGGQGDAHPQGGCGHRRQHVARSPVWGEGRQRPGACAHRRHPPGGGTPGTWAPASTDPSRAFILGVRGHRPRAPLCRVPPRWRTPVHHSPSLRLPRGRAPRVPGRRQAGPGVGSGTSSPPHPPQRVPPSCCHQRREYGVR